MKMSILFIFLTSLLSCKSITMPHGISSWEVNPTNKTTKIKAVTSYYGGYEGLKAHTHDIIIQLGFEIDDNTNPIITKPKIVFGRWARYSISCHDTEIIISGEVVEPSIGGSSEVSTTNFRGIPIVKGSGQFGTAWFEKMMVIAQAMRDATFYYSEK